MLDAGRKYHQHRNEHGNTPIDIGIVPQPLPLHGMPAERLPTAPSPQSLPSPSARLYAKFGQTGRVPASTGARSKEPTVPSEPRKASSSEDSEADYAD